METEIEERLERIEERLKTIENMLKRQNLNNMTNWTVKELAESTGRSTKYIKDRLVNNEVFMPKLESDGVVIYPEGVGGAININTKKMLHFIEENHSKIFGREVYK